MGLKLAWHCDLARRYIAEGHVHGGCPNCTHCIVWQSENDSTNIRGRVRRGKRLTHIAGVLILSIIVGGTHQGRITIAGIGEVQLPPGQWILERAVVPDESSHTPEVFVFKKVGDRLERVTFQRFGPHIARPIEAYFDSIGDSMSNGVPIHLLDFESDHDTAHIMRGIIKLEATREKTISLKSSYIYTSERKDHFPWMSHAFVRDCGGWVLVCVHASPYVISPETIENVCLDSRFEEGMAGAREATTD